MHLARQLIDRLEGQPWNPSAAQALVALVCLLIDTLQFRQTPAAMLADSVELGPAPEADIPEVTDGEMLDDPSATMRIDAGS